MNISSEKQLDIRALLYRYTRNWKWFIVSVIIFLIFAFLYLRYTQSQYQSLAKIQILEDDSSGPELSVFKDLDVFSGSENKIEDEIEILKSRSNFIDLVKQLNLNVKVVSIGKIVNTELYDSPRLFNIKFLDSDSLIQNSKFDFYINLHNATTFGYREEEDKPEKKYSYGESIESPIGGIIILPNNENLESYNEKKYMVSIKTVSSVAEEYKKKIAISPAGDGSSIINISLNDVIPRKANDIINKLIEIYNKNAVNDKKAIADKTSKFINERIKEISTDLSSTDQTAQDFKTGKGLTDLASEASLNLNVGAASKQELQNAQVQLNIAASMKDLVENQSTYDILPSNVGLADASIATTTVRYNELVSERNRLLKSSNEKNPIIVNIDQELSSLKKGMQSSLNSMTNNLNLQVNSLSTQLSQINSKIYSAPKNERALRDITRQQQTKESLYLYLLQKREESQITFASASPKSKILDLAYKASEFPVSPKKPLVILASIILGLLMPFSIIYINQLLDNKVHNKTTLEESLSKINIPVLGELPKLSRKGNKLIHKDDRSILAESLRIIRTNLDYLVKPKKMNDKKGNIIYITSSVPGEGKTFLSSNLSMILANTNKKVLLIGADIRNPKIYTFFSSKDVDLIGKPKRNKGLGLTEYLNDQSILSQDIINPMLVHTNTVDVIYSGKIAPNPAELLMSDRIKQLLDDVSDIYDYVIVDTAPLMVVTDTLLITKYASHVVYVTRAGVTETKVIDFPIKLKEEGKLPSLSFVVNDVKESNLGYGGKYGYGYGKSLKKWWKFS